MIKRPILLTLIDELSEPYVTILLGPRQAGKTTLLKQLHTHVLTRGHSATYFDLEQPDILASLNISPADIIAQFKKAGPYIFIDEFHYLKNASKIFKAIYDSDASIKIVCSGSSSLEIHKHLKESLAGRRILYRISPLSYFEMKQTDTSLSDYCQHGGMPGLTHTHAAPRKQQLLSELLSAYLLKDIKSLIKEENMRAFNHLLYLLAENQGSLVSVHSLATHVQMSSKAINRYLDILEQTYVNFRVYSYSTNLGNELKKSCKTYLYDIGIRNTLLKNFSPLSERKDKGTILETFTFLHLYALLAPTMELRFWRTRTGDEVDFILLHNTRPIPIEVKSTLTNTTIPKGIARFLSCYPQTPIAYVVNESITMDVVFKTHIVKFITFENIATIIPA